MDYRIGFLFPTNRIGLVATLLIIGIGCIVTGLYLPGILLSFIWFFLQFTTKRISLDYEKQQIMLYFSTIGIKIGQERPSNDFPFYTIKNKLETHQTSTGVYQQSYSNYRIGLYLVDIPNKREVLIKTGEKQELMKVVNELEKLGIKRKK